MKKSFKKCFKSPVVFVFYLLAFLLMAYTVYEIIAVCNEISTYYASVEGQSGKFSEYLTYSFQSGIQSFIWSLIMFGFGYVIRMLKQPTCETEEKADKADGYEDMTKKELSDLCKKKGIKVTSRMTKDALIEALRA